MEPLLDKLARQGFVKKIVATIRNMDKRSDKWMLSKPLKWRVLLLIIIACLTLPVAVGGVDAIFVIGVILCLVNYVFLLPNFCLIVTARQSVTFKLIQLGIFVAYLVPVAMAFFYSDEFWDHFSLLVVLFPVGMLLHFIYLIFAWRRIRESAAWTAVKFVVSMLLMCVICTIAWEAVVAENLYNDTDDNSLGFLTPGQWVSNWDGQHPIVQVDHIVHGGSMSDPDTIKRGWTIADLWFLWFGFIGVSVIFSLGLAWLPWMPGERDILTGASTR
ncbi:MAG TPA: hypothetical protein VMF08_05790 [Candidatus Sulfotelmatobacter sp.]|nr:hypothetical protein [Candidatus Sulfotelmatobacter sp.]